MSNVICTIGTILLPVEDGSCTPVQGLIVHVLCNFSKEDLPINDLEAPVACDVNIFLQFIMVWKSAVVIIYVYFHYFIM